MSPRAAWRLETLGFETVFDYVAGKEDWLASNLPIEGELSELATIGGAAEPDVPTCHVTERLGEVQSRLRATNGDFCVVVNDARIVLGLLRKDLWNHDADQPVNQIMESGPPTFRPHVTVKAMKDHVVRKKLDVILVTTSSGRLIGALAARQLAVSSKQ